MRALPRVLLATILVGTLAAALNGAPPAAVTIDYGQTKQPVDGFGAAITWIAGDLHRFTPAQQTDILDKLYSTTQPSAGLSIVRGGTFLCEFNPSAGVYNWSHPLIQDEMTWMTRVRTQYGVDRFLASTWTPPAWMKSNNSCAGGGHVLPQFYPQLAQLQVLWLQNARASMGVDVAVMSVQNEPDLAPSYDSAEYTVSELTDFTVNYLRPAMQGAGLPTAVMAPEGSVYGGGAFFDSHWGFPLLDNPAMRAAIDVVGTHGYGVSDLGDPSRAVLQYGERIWQTEDMDSRGRWNGSITDGLSWATEISKALSTGNFSAWLYWWATGIYNNNGALIFVDLAAQTYQVPKRIYTIGNFSRFIRPGSVVVGATSSDSALRVNAVRSATGGAIVVLLNSTKSTKVANVTLQNLGTVPSSVTPYRTSATENQAQLAAIAVSAGAFTITIPAQSIVTLDGN
jgi:glucuronoarabinoxylan endo-1,4-beta-xylanase